MQNSIDTFLQGNVDAGLRAALNKPWESVLHLARRLSASKRELIRLTPSMETDFYYISSGKICLQTFSANGKESSSNYLGSGCIFNMVSVFAKEFEDATCTWRALEDTVFWRFPGALLHNEDFVRNHPDLIINLMRSMSFSLIIYHSWLSRTQQTKPVYRLSHYLVGVAMAAGSLDFIPAETQQEVATRLGMHRATLAAAVKQLKEERIIESFHHKRLHILDMHRLKIFAGV